MTDKDIKILQASIDNMHVKLITIYSDCLTAAIEDKENREAMKSRISCDWTASYVAAQAAASQPVP